MIEAAQDVHERAFSRAGSAHQCDVFAALDVQRNAFQYRHVHLAQVIRLVNIFQLDQRHIFYLRLPNCGANGLVVVSVASPCSMPVMILPPSARLPPLTFFTSVSMPSVMPSVRR